MIRNETTVYNKPINIYTTIDSGIELTARAVPSPDSGAYMSNVMIMADNGKDIDGIFINLDKDDAPELCQDLMDAKMDTAFLKETDYTTTLISGVKTTAHIIIQGHEYGARITIDDQNPIPINVNKVKEFCDNIIKACDQASEIYECNKNLSKQMAKLRDDMKAEKVFSLYFDILDEVPEMYKNQEMNIVALYEITARDKDENPLYSFLRAMHLTGVPMVDYRDYGKDFLSCPFVYSDKLLKKGQDFIEKKKTGLHDYVDSKTGKKS